MTEFAILHPETKIHSHHLIEASAGTGKTFSIENLFVRLLLETDPCLGRPLLVEEIATVTFTKAATEELKRRIHTKLTATAKEVECFLTQDTCASSPYLQALLFNKQEAEHLLQTLKRALFSIEEAKIFTIHSFCYKLLKEHYYAGKVAASLIEEEEAKEIAKEAIYDYFQSALPGITVAQARLLISHFRGEEQLKLALLQAVQGSKEIAFSLSGKELLKKAQTIYPQCYANIATLSKDELFSCLNTLFQRRRSADSKEKEKILSKKHLYKLVLEPELSEQDFDRLITDGVPFFAYCEKEYVRTPLPPHPNEKDLLSYLEPLHKVIEEGRAPAKIFAVVAAEIRRLFLDKLQKNHCLSFDSLLQQTAFACRQKTFVEKVRKELKAVIIDEFQDTDPVQWRIFRTLFLTKTPPTYLYLVGDPKQSIYAFRSADIYTYLQAYKDLGQDAVKTLATNWRSSSSLVEGINYLFSENLAPKFLYLPKQEQHLPCPSVKSGQGQLPFPCQERKAIHFFCKDYEQEEYKPVIFENDFLAPALIEELTALNKKGVAWEKIALIVKDRSQLGEVKKWLNTAQIPYSDCVGRKSMEGYAIEELLAYIRALISPKKIGVLKRALASPLFGFDEEKLRALSDLQVLGNVLQEFQEQKKEVQRRGFAAAFYSFLRKIPIWGGVSPWQRLHSCSDFEVLREDLSSILDSLLSEKKALSLEEAVRKLEQLHYSPPPVKIQRQEGVQLTTLHSSKGLEWDVVVALAHLRGHGSEDRFVSVSKQGEVKMQAAEENAEDTRLHLLEKDAEQARLFYVLVTRAKHRLYIPLAYNFKQSQGAGRKSMQELWLESASSFTDPLPLFTHPSLSFQMLYSACLLPRQWKEASFTSLTPPHFCFASSRLTSFSSLTKTLPYHLSPLQPPRELDLSLKTADTLPASAEVGTLLHALFEEVSLQGENLSSLVKEKVSATSFCGWEKAIEAIIQNTLQADLGGFSFADIDPSLVWREVEFSFEAEDLFCDLLPKDQVKGFIDLIFFHKGHWYIIDWKSNWLGPSEACYTQERIYEEMARHRYLLQASLYKQALSRYLREQGKEGAITCLYFFVRGCKAGTQNGVFTVPS